MIKDAGFHAFTTKYNGLTNRIITDITVCQAFDPIHTPKPSFPLHQTKALWDTGATGSVITTSTAQALKLIPSGNTMVNHAGGTSQSNTYVVNIYLPNNVGIAGVLVSECHDTAGDFGVIIGMDIITKGDLSITNVKNRTWMSFRIPSTHGVDYVLDAKKIQFSGIGRNAPCPCGAVDSKGRRLKLKQCCGKDLH